MLRGKLGVEAALHAMSHTLPAQPTPQPVTLRDGQVAFVGPPGAGDEPEVAELVRGAADARDDLFAAARRAHAGGRAGALVARGAADGRLIGCVAWVGGDDGDGELGGYVKPESRGLGLGTLLVRRAIADAAVGGLQRLRVELHPGSEAAAEMLRDLGLATRWSISYPVVHVTITLGQPRPGWSTPELGGQG